MAAALRRILSMGDNVPRRELNAAERDDLMRLRSLQELPKARYASKVALTALPTGRGRKVVYSHVDLYKMVENIANTLREQGVRPDTVCATALPNCVEAIVYFLAIVWIGAIAAPIDVELELNDVIRALRASKAATLVSPLVDEDDAPEDILYQRMKQAAETLELVEWHITRTTNEGVVLETHGRRAAEGAAWSGGASDFQAEGTRVAVYMASVSEDDALVLPLTHQNFAAAIRMFSHTYDIDATHVTILSRPWSTVDALNAMLATIYSGGHLVMPGRAQEPNEEFVKLCKEYKVDWFTASPQFLGSLASLKERNSSAMSGLKFKFIRSVTGHLDSTALDALEDTFNAPVLEAYGTPETCGVVSCNVQSELRAGTKGTPAADCVIKIYDEKTREPVATGVEGIVGVAGANVTSGYLDNDEANNGLIVKEENADGSETIFILTGDRGFLDDDGFLHMESDIPDSRTETFAQERALNTKRLKQAMTATVATTSSSFASAIGTRSLSAETRSDSNDREKEAAEKKERADREAVALEKAHIEKKEAERKKREAAKEKEEAERMERKAAEEKEEKERQDRIAAEEKARREAAEEEERLKREIEKAEEKERQVRESAEQEKSSGTRGLVGGAAAIGAAELAASAVHNRSSSSSSSSTSDMNSPRFVQHTASDMMRTRSGTKVAYVQQPPLEVSTFDPCALDEISARLGVIEANQRRLENEVMAQHAEDLASLRKLMDIQNKALPSMPVEMDKVTSVLNKATNAAVENQKRSEEALAAARAAVDIAAAKSMARSPRGVLHHSVTINLSHVESVITRHVSVEQARVFGRGGDGQVYCAVKMKNGARVSEQWLKLHAQTTLPATHVPKVFYEYDAMTPETTREQMAKMKDLKAVSATATTADAANAVAPTGGGSTGSSPKSPSRRKKITINASSWIPSLRNVRSGRTSMTP